MHSIGHATPDKTGEHVGDSCEGSDDGQEFVIVDVSLTDDLKGESGD